MGDLEKMDLECWDGDTKTTATRIRVKKNKIAELDHKIIEENVEEGLEGSTTQLPLAAAAVSIAFASVAVICYFRFRRRR